MAVQKELAALLDEARTPSIITVAEIKAAAKAAFDVASRIQQQNAVVRGLMLNAEMSAGGDIDRGRVEKLRATIVASDKDAAEFIQHFRRMVIAAEQADRFAAEIHTEVTNIAAAAVD